MERLYQFTGWKIKIGKAARRMTVLYNLNHANFIVYTLAFKPCDSEA